MAPNSTQRSIIWIGRILGMRFENLAMKYLGCPIYSGRKKLSFFSEMVCKAINRVKGWHLKFFFSRGRAVIIRHVLLPLNIHEDQRSLFMTVGLV